MSSIEMSNFAIAELGWEVGSRVFYTVHNKRELI